VFKINATNNKNPYLLGILLNSTTDKYINVTNGEINKKIK